MAFPIQGVHGHTMTPTSYHRLRVASAIITSLIVAPLAYAQAPANSSIEPILGLAFNEVSPGTVVATAVEPASPFDKLGFKKGDVILSIGEREISTAKQLDTSLR